MGWINPSASGHKCGCTFLLCQLMLSICGCLKCSTKLCNRIHPRPLKNINMFIFKIPVNLCYLFSWRRVVLGLSIWTKRRLWTRHYLLLRDGKLPRPTPLALIWHTCTALIFLQLSYLSLSCPAWNINHIYDLYSTINLESFMMNAFLKRPYSEYLIRQF